MSVPHRHTGEKVTFAHGMVDDVLAAAAFRSDLSGVLEETARQTAEACRAREVAVGIVNGAEVRMTIWSVENGRLGRTDHLVVSLDSSETVARAVRDGHPVGPEADSNAEPMSADLVVPMVANERVVGVVVVTGSGYETQLPTQVISTIASRSALAVDYVRFRKESRKALEETVTVMAAVIEGRDAYTESHCRHLAETSLALGVRLELENDRLDRLTFGGLLHDIGKVAVPDTILSKPGALTDREWDQMKTHAAIGEDILTRIGSLAEVAPIVGQHHERLDGSGYPRGLKGDDILLEARILAVVDTFDAMTTTRPYRAALPWSRAVEEISSESGALFDPEVVDIFLRYMTGEEAQWKRRSPT